MRWEGGLETEARQVNKDFQNVLKLLCTDHSSIKLKAVHSCFSRASEKSLITAQRYKLDLVCEMVYCKSSVTLIRLQTKRKEIEKKCIKCKGTTDKQTSCTIAIPSPAFSFSPSLKGTAAATAISAHTNTKTSFIGFKFFANGSLSKVC